MQAKYLTTLCLWLALTSNASAQGFSGGGLTTVAGRDYHHSGPYLEVLLPLGDTVIGPHKIGSSAVYAVLLPTPGARFTLNFSPAYFAQRKVKPFVDVGGQWINLPGPDEWHSTLTVGAQIPGGLQVRISRLYLAPTGYRVGGDWLRPVKASRWAWRVTVDYTVNRHATDYTVIAFGVVRLF